MLFHFIWLQEGTHRNPTTITWTFHTDCVVTNLWVARPGWLVSHSQKSEGTRDIKQILYVDMCLIVMVNNTNTFLHHQHPSEADVKITAEGMELVLQLQRNEWVTAHSHTFCTSLWGSTIITVYKYMSWGRIRPEKLSMCCWSVYIVQPSHWTIGDWHLILLLSDTGSQAYGVT